MIRYRSILALAGGIMALGHASAQAEFVTAPAGTNLLEDRPNSAIVKIAANTAVEPSTAAREPAPAGNPLWMVPVQTLTATRERPLFSPSRRPPPPPPAVASAPPPKPAAPPPAEPDHPLLSLLGTIVGSSGSIGVFLDPASNSVVRLRTGENHTGWTLRSVAGREAKFEKNNRTATLALPPRNAEPVAQSVSPAGVGVPVAGAPPLFARLPSLLISPPPPRPTPAETQGRPPAAQEL
jgi:hypothetical protein